MKRTFLLLAALFLLAPAAKADKGMWILKELNKENRDRMRQLGFTMAFDKLYNENAPALHNSVVIFGRGCTGITVSNQGLIFTNHHCGYSSIQQLSSVEHDYLRDGFVSHALNQELPVPGLTVQYLRGTEDITDKILKAVEGITDEMARIKAIQAEIAKIEKEVEKEPNTTAKVYPFYNNNKYYLISYDVFKDVRMVFAPPSSIGKFGGDTDNWMWPRHTGDFSVFRVYADANNRPAAYNANNKPFKPKAFAKISLSGVSEKDYAMTIGFPGRTNRYLSSWGVENLIKNENTPRIEVRGLKQDVWKSFMEKEQAIRIQYSDKYALSSNYWKNSIGMNKGLRRLNVITEKQKIEKDFARFAASTPERKAKYGFVLDSLRIPIEKMGEYTRNLQYISEAYSGFEVVRFAIKPEAARKANLDAMYKDFSPKVAKATLPVMLRVVKENVAPEYLPSIYKTIDADFGGDLDKYTAFIYGNSVFVSKERFQQALANPEFNDEAYQKDPVVALRTSFIDEMHKLSDMMAPYRGSLLKGERLFFAGLREKDPKKALPSDANFTMRMSYGSVSGYKPYDAGWYDYYTTSAGIFEKQDPSVSEFRVQPEILDLLSKKSFGRYADKKGNLRLCFLSDNDITGGNSGSPVFNKNGDLIGLAFDGNWEAMSGDIEFEANMQRTISVDIRYVMWVIDMWGKSKYLVDEVSFVK
ncbi:S46 family peptidase [Porphyromonas sp. COT-108 OH1349]|uniref:S46 family peptidase n=1 Tax=Porphyromonas sp. COT-108 OH1349 TaxID=1537504 RepID=UPI00052D34A4|nr:S46 family peptidase [Porphyromonas sp. COT-108 OH1349]KGN71484.1 peptidase S10 [Porphyromonas sp. COT-108 OH1349]